jgi:hypothetical protein
MVCHLEGGQGEHFDLCMAKVLQCTDFPVLLMKIRPKRCQTCCLGLGMFVFFLSCFFSINNVFFLLSIGFIEDLKGREGLG